MFIVLYIFGAEVQMTRFDGTEEEAIQYVISSAPDNYNDEEDDILIFSFDDSPDGVPIFNYSMFLNGEY